MRLNAQELETIRSEIHKLDPDCEIFLFGSRIDDSKKGGDIDLLVLSDRLKFKERIDLLVVLKQRLGDQKIDLLIREKSSVQQDPFIEEIMRTGVRIEAAK